VKPETKEKITTTAKKPSVWGGVVTIATALTLLLQTCNDIRGDIKEVREKVGMESSTREEKGKQVETEVSEAVKDLQDKLQFIYDEGALLKDLIDDLELENRRLRASFSRFRSSGVNGSPEDMTDSDVESLAHRLLPFMYLGTSVEKDPPPAKVDAGGEIPPPPEFDPRYEVQKRKAKKLVGPDGQLKFESMGTVY
jgi:hypothetical protein